jgi:hypothetical protein
MYIRKQLMARLVTNGARPTLPLYNFSDVQAQFYFAGIQPDNLHRFTNSSLKSYMKNQLTRVTRGQLTCTTEALLHVPAFNVPTVGNHWGSVCGKSYSASLRTQAEARLAPQPYLPLENKSAIL